MFGRLRNFCGRHRIAAAVEPKFSCPKCGSELFKPRTEIKSYDDFIGSICEHCGTAITEDDVKRQAIQIADKRIRDALRKSGFK